MAERSTVTLKIKLKGCNDMRRVTVSPQGYTFAQLAEKLQNLYKYKNLSESVVKYFDPEGDKITITSDEELEEAFNLVGANNILRLFVIPEAKSKDCAKNSSESFAERVEEVSTQILAEIGAPAIEKDLKEMLAQVSANFPPHFTRCAPRRRLSQVFRRRLFHSLKCTAYKLLASSSSDRDQLTKARDYYLALLKLWPNHAVSVYNLACAESLLGNKDAACAALRSSVELGYRDSKHMKQDSDLDNIREEPAYLSVISDLENGTLADACRRFSAHRRFGRFGRFGGRHGCRGRWHQRHKRCDKSEVAPQAAPESVDEPKPEEQVAEPEVVVEDVVEPEAAEEPKGEEAASEQAEIPAGVTQSAIDTAKDFAAALESLTAMGFSDRNANIKALIQARGDLTGAVQILIAQ